MAEPPPLPSSSPPPALAPYPRSGPPEYPPDEPEFDDKPPPRRRRNERDSRDDYDDDIDLRLPRRRRRRTPSGNDWSTASVGMKLIFGAMIAVMLSFLIIHAAKFGEPPPNALDPPQQRQEKITGIGGCFLIMGSVVLFIGSCLCCAAPDRSAHGWALASVLVLVAAVVVACIGGVVVYEANANRNRGVFNPAVMGTQTEFLAVLVLVLLICVLSFVFAMLFHAATARALGNDALLHQAYWYLAAPFVAAGLGFAMLVLVGVQTDRGHEPSPFGYVMLSVFQMVLSTVIFGWYAAICWQTFRTMDRAALPRSG
jgi:hypothetical protein